MRRRGNGNIDAPGQDSFLDIVANLVGILIILVIIVGVRARDAVNHVAPTAAIGADEPVPDVEAARVAAAAVEQSIQETERRISKQQFEILYRQKERDKTLLLVTALEKRLERETEALNAAERVRFEREKESSEASFELARLNQQRDALTTQAVTKKVIRHLPTPMAKTVFGREVHFRLREGRVMFIPWDELIGQLKAEAPEKVWKLRDAERITETIGPLGGFWMKYTLKRTAYAVETRAGSAVQKRVELDRFILVPVKEGGGETLSEAGNPQSYFREVLARYKPNQTTVTVWVYPDSFEEFRQLKQDLFKMGYLTAGRPLPADQPIGGSPQGTRSAGQ